MRCLSAGRRPGRPSNGKSEKDEKKWRDLTGQAGKRKLWKELNNVMQTDVGLYQRTKI